MVAPILKMALLVVKKIILFSLVTWRVLNRFDSQRAMVAKMLMQGCITGSPNGQVQNHHDNSIADYRKTKNRSRIERLQIAFKL